MPVRARCCALLPGVTIDPIATKHDVHPILAGSFYVPVFKHRSGIFDSK